MQYQPVIGYEIHVELSTNTKVFCACSTKFGHPPNTQVCPVCLGMPGSLPVLNRKAFQYALRAALALNCDIAPTTDFERKNYYYPDLPKNYQISQLRRNLAENGYIDILVGEEKKRIRINNIHLEEDAGKNVHPEAADDDYSLVDLNRAGTPLLEIVSEPDIHSAQEAMAYMQAMKNLLEYIEISDCNMHQGRLRFEVNISHRPIGSDQLPDFRSEIKNLGSMKVAVKCIEYETKRQTRALRKNEKLTQDTRLWNEERTRTESMRTKENANDYRYFPDPDLVEVKVTEEWIKNIRKELPELPTAKKTRFKQQYQLPEYDAQILTASRKIADYYETAIKNHNNPKTISNWIMTDLLRELSERDIQADQSPIQPQRLAQLVELIDDGTISGKIAKKVFQIMLDNPKPPKEIVEEQGMVQVKDTGQVEQWVEQVIQDNPGPAQDFASGKDKAIGFLVGQVMRLSRGKANPQMVNEIITRKLRS